ncbi:cobyrinate a,c-diamide synthase [Paraconexibacter antarcticus]|uniref:Hydrogenobyrinate a,c-diamide synthase n=1 Tax=Paraconexibacter antarcticus TaxID=2949664 RepID=A0ABY5DR29_9ACTN|nr:cobyrinate a,c-diamide synthase [Paraconexibacter antarcticus]UTI64121.1 cobyrinate a,c-diamide synthase [Paraconexibacter antarcticus]
MIPRIVVAGTSSGAGKTTVACGLIGALRARGLTVQGFKVGPDYIDPSHHALASGRPGRNLDAFLSGPDLVAPLVHHGSAGADIAVIEGVMGLFDGASGRGELASTAHVAKLLDAPVLLVLDAAAMARSAAAMVHGFRTFDPQVKVAGVIFNKVGSDIHEQLLREAIEGSGLPVLGALRRDERVTTPERHLGLVPVAEREHEAREALAALAEAATRYVDMDAVVRLAGAAPEVAGPTWSPVAERPVVRGTRIAIARGPAFSFHYQENLELLEGAGAELVGFDPMRDEALPEGAGALVLAGGFPEVFGAELSANARLRAEVAAFAASGRPILAECGGLLYLCESLDGHAMCGVLPARAEMAGRLTLGYREATATTATPWLPAGTAVRGHEFHYSKVQSLDPRAEAAWQLSTRTFERPEGIVRGAVQAGYLHVHWGAHPEIARGFAAAAAPLRAVKDAVA